jgi:hypothetical protein
MPRDAGVAGPGEHRVRGRFGAIVADDHLRRAPPGDQIGQLAHDPPARDRGVYHRPDALARHVADDVEHAEPPSGDELVVDEVQAPALVGERRHRCRRPRACGATSVLPTTHRQTLFAVEPLGLLAINRDAVAAKQDVQPSITEPPALLRQLA